jgi:hypothetical protein
MSAEEGRRVAEHLVAHLELAHSRADGFDLAGQLDAERSRPRPAHPEDETPQEQIGPTSVGIGLRDRAGSDPDEDLVVLRDGPFDLFDPEHLRRPIPVLDNGFHSEGGSSTTTSV